MSGPARGTPAQLADLKRSLAIDAAPDEVVEALRTPGIPSLLLKGPAIARRLYARDGVRGYVDIDLLVAPEQVAPAERVLEALGYHDRPKPGALWWGKYRRETHAHPWQRDGSPSVDLHFTLEGVEAPPGEVWAELVRDCGTLRLAAVDVPVPSGAGLAFIITLHAAKHGRSERKPLRDLERALDRLPLRDWQQARELCVRLRAEISFGAGLSMLPAGVERGRELGLEPVSTTHLELISSAVPGPGMFLERLRELPGPRAKLGFAVHNLFPPPEFMRAWSPLARRGALGLGLAYLGRPFWILGRTPGGLRDWWRARSAAG